MGRNEMTEVLQRSVESTQTADIFDIAQNNPKKNPDLPQLHWYGYLVIDTDAHVDIIYKQDTLT